MQSESVNKQAKKNNKIFDRNLTLVLDLSRIVTGIIIFALGIVAFLNPKKNITLFPVVFFIAGLLNSLESYCHFRQCSHDKQKKIIAVITMIAAFIMFSLSFFSTLSILKG